MAEPTKKKRRHWAFRVIDATLLLVTLALLVYLWPVRFGGSTTFVIVGGHSMEPTYDIGDIAVLRKGDPQIGDVVAFDPQLQSPNAPLVIHRIIGGDPDGWITQGDNNPNPDPWEPTSDQIAGIAQFHIPGGLRIINLFHKPLFYALLMGIAVIVILWPRKKPDGDGSDDEDDGPSDPVDGADRPDDSESSEPAPPGDAATPTEPAGPAAVAALAGAPLAHRAAPRMRGALRAPTASGGGRSGKIRLRGATKALAGGLAVLVVASLVASSAASTTVQADDLTAQMIPGNRCDDVISVEPSHSGSQPLLYDRVTLTDVAPACAGLSAEIVVKDDAGDALATGAAVAASPSFVVTFSPEVNVADFGGIALAIDGWGIPTVPVGDDVQSDVTIDDDWGDGYCATVITSTTSPDPIPWVATIDLSTYPLNGVPNQWWWDVDVEFDDPVLTATGYGQQELISLGNPTEWGFCAEREPEPPEPGQAFYYITTDNDWGAGYCATVHVWTLSVAPITWIIDVPINTYPYNGTPYTQWNVSFQQPYFTSATGVGWNSQIDHDSPAEWGFCANR